MTALCAADPIITLTSWRSLLIINRGALMTNECCEGNYLNHHLQHKYHSKHVVSSMQEMAFLETHKHHE